MNKKIYALSFTLALALLLAGIISAFSGRTAASVAGSALSALPASDVVITFDTQRLLSETLPTIFAENPALLAKANNKIEEFKKETGIDPRTFDSVAVGLRFKPTSADDFDAVIVVRGRFNANEVIDTGFATAKARNEVQKREEQYEGKTIFVITSHRPARVSVSKPDAKTSADAATDARTAPDAEASGTEQEALKSEPKDQSNQMAVVALDANTIAAGDLKSVRAAVDAGAGRGRVDDELVRMATQNPSALVGFSGKIPPSVTEKMAGGKGMEAQYFAAIREFYGSFGTTGMDAEAFIAVRTENASQAHDISQALNAMKLFGGLSLAQPSKGEVRSAAEILKDLSITSQNNEVQIKLNIKQKDLAPFVRKF